jgi:hypothetical protein
MFSGQILLEANSLHNRNAMSVGCAAEGSGSAGVAPASASLCHFRAVKEADGDQP